MSEMIERVGRAMANRRGWDASAPAEQYGFGLSQEPVWRVFRDDARAALEALREPTEEMLEAGMVAITHPAETIHSLDQQAASIFTAMINQILSTSPQAGREG